MGMKYKKGKARLEARIKAHERMCSNSHHSGREYTKPGSMKK